MASSCGSNIWETVLGAAVVVVVVVEVVGIGVVVVGSRRVTGVVVKSGMKVIILWEVVVSIGVGVWVEIISFTISGIVVASVIITVGAGVSVGLKGVVGTLIVAVCLNTTASKWFSLPKTKTFLRQNDVNASTSNAFDVESKIEEQYSYV